MNCHILSTVPNDLFVRATLGSIDIKFPTDAITVFSRLSITCKDIHNKVNLIWKLIIEHSDLIKYLFPSEIGTLENSKEFLKSNYQTIKKWSRLDLQKWKIADPQITESRLPGFMEQCVLHNDQKNPQLWVSCFPRKKLVCVDLITQSESVLNLKEELKTASYVCNPCMASSDSWIAICCDLEETMEIAVIDKISGARLHTISNLGKIFKIECENNYLYALSKNGENCKFLQFDSREWKSSPKELQLPIQGVIYFYIGMNDLLFSTKLNQLLAISKENYFSNKKPSFIIQETQFKHPKIQICKDEFFTLSCKDISKSECVLVSKLCISNSVIKTIPIKTLSLSLAEICDFDVHLDKIFITKKLSNRIFCYDLITGNLMKEFSATTQECFGTNFMPKLVTSAARIQFLFSTTEKKINSHQVRLCTASLTLNYT